MNKQTIQIDLPSDVLLALNESEDDIEFEIEDEEEEKEREQ